MTPVIKMGPPPKQFNEEPHDVADLKPLKPFQSLTPNPKCDKQRLDIDFKGL